MRLCAAAVSISLALSVALAACGRANSASTSAGQGSPATTSSTSSSLITSTTTTVVTSTVSAPASPPMCVAADLAPSFIGQQGATGHGLLGFALHNVSGHTCHTYGYPGILFLDKSGHALPTESTRTTHDFFGPAPEVRLTLAPGATVSFRLGVTHGAVPNEPCTTAYALLVIPPDDTHTLVAKITGGAYECRTATVSPLRPGSSAYP